jgi:hypothetical protein
MGDANQSDLVRVTGLWLKRSKRGRSYLTGAFGQATVYIFRTARAEGDDDGNSPAYALFVAPKVPKASDAGDHEHEPRHGLSDDDAAF